MNTKNKNILKMLGILLAGFLLGWIFFGGNNTSKTEHEHNNVENTETIWTCSMHPQIRMNEPGQCPICGMELIPLDSNGSALDPDAIQMTEDAMKLANVQTMIVGGGKNANKKLALNGKVQIDERKLYTQSTHIPGRIEKLTVNFTGEKVNRGQTLAMVYSPEMVTAQEELLQAYHMKESQPELFEAAKQKLSNWKIGESTINKIITSNKPIQQFPITADVTGIITAKKVDLGDYVDQGMPIYEIADLSSLWVLFDVYESDMSWIKVGNKINYSIQSLPGESFEGVITFIDPLINPQTRVASARVEVKNSNNKLKPEMFVSGIVNKNISTSESKDIVIPKTAIMWTGERSIVYMKSVVSNKVNFKLREVTLGTSLGDAYIIKEGLSEGEEIVVNGTFTVDAASQLAGKPSMMNISDDKNNRINQSEFNNNIELQRIKVSSIFQEQLKTVFKDYLNLKDALVKDNFKGTKRSSKDLVENLNKVDMELISDKKTHIQWMALDKKIKSAANNIFKAETIEKQRTYFKQLSLYFTNAIQIFGVNQTVYKQFCPMVNDNQGAYWLSLTKEIYNPYFGDAMLTCGSTKEVIE